MRAEWTPAATNGQKLAGYTLEVTDAKGTVIDSVDAGPYARAAVVPLAKPGLRVGLVARGESGHHTGSSTLRVTTDPRRDNYSVTVGSWDRPIAETSSTDTPRVVTPPADGLSSTLAADNGSVLDTIVALIRSVLAALATWLGITR